MALQWQETPSKNLESTDQASISSSQNPWFVIFIGLMGLIVGYGIGKWQGNPFLFVNIPSAQVAQAPTPQVPQQPPEPTSIENLPDIDPQVDHIRGDVSKATIAVVEYSDFECPFCKRHHPTMQQIMDTYQDDVVWVYRHFPLPFHPNAQKAAESSECANELGGNDAFWQFTDGVFELDALSTDAFVTVAKNIGLNETTFKQCLDSGKYAQHVQDDMSGGSTAGVNGTPGNIVVNLKTDENRIISGAVPFASFKTAIDALLGSDPAAAQAPTDGARTIKMTAEFWKFTPSVIRVKQGEQVTLEIAGISGTHGIAIPDLGIDETIMQGGTVSVKIPTNKTGTFDFRCSVQCGSGHNDMTGKIIIEG